MQFRGCAVVVGVLLERERPADVLDGDSQPRGGFRLGNCCEREGGGEGVRVRASVVVEGEGGNGGEREGKTRCALCVPVMVRVPFPRWTEKATSPTAALASARPWTSSVTALPLIDTILSPLTSRPEAAPPSETSVTTTLAPWSVSMLMVSPRRVVGSGLSTGQQRGVRRDESGCEGREWLRVRVKARRAGMKVNRRRGRR